MPAMMTVPKNVKNMEDSDQGEGWAEDDLIGGMLQGPVLEHQCEGGANDNGGEIEPEKL